MLWAVLKKNVTLVNLLISERANVNHQTKVKSTPLIVAAKEGSLEMSKILVENGADVNAVTQVCICFNIQFEHK